MTDKSLMEILMKQYDSAYSYVDEDTVDGSVSCVLSAMGEAVQKGSIGFAEWICKNAFESERKYFWCRYEPEDKLYTATELYDEYIKSLSAGH